MPRSWDDAEREVIDKTPRTWARTQKLTLDQVHEIRRRADSLSIPFTVDELAQREGITTDQARLIIKRKRWRERVHEPVDYRR